jgi:hypothetical protein
MSHFSTSDCSILLVGWGREFPTGHGLVDFGQRAEKLGYYSMVSAG